VHNIDKNFNFVEQKMDQIKLYNILRNALKMTEQDAGDFMSAMGAVASRELDTKIQALATKDDLRELALATKNDILDLNKKIYIIGLVQFIAIVTSMLAIVKFIR
jgi:hypothetical protein